jgi:NADH dehydrogenase
MHLVVGATGHLGGEVCRELAARDLPVRALVRASSDPDRVAVLRALGCEIAVGDLRDADSLRAACRGATAVLSSAATTAARLPDDTIGDVDLDGQRRLVDAARAAGVRRFVYVSFSGGFDLDSPFQAAKRGVERHLRESGLPYTILRPSVFMETWLGPAAGFDYRSATVRLLGDGDRPVSWVSARDVARFAVACLDRPAAENAVIELGGPEALTAHEVVRVFEEESGRTFTVEHVPEAALEAQWREATDPRQRTFAAFMLGVARGDAIDMRETLAAVPVPLTTVREYARRVLAG